MTSVGELQTAEQRTGTYGVVLGLLVGSRFFPYEIQRAPDTSGEPNTTAAQTIAIRPASPPARYVDWLENDQQTRWYRARHVKNTYTDSDWTNWVGAKPVAVQWYRMPDLPSYPRTEITQEQPQTQPENVAIRLRGWPEHDDTVFRYAYVASTENVPLRSESTADWSTYSTSLNLVRDASDVRKLAAWGALNGIWGPVSVAEIGPDLRPQITGDPSWSEDTGIIVQSSYALVKDAQTVAIDIYRRKTSWPTMNSSSGGGLDQTYYKGNITSEDNWVFADDYWNASEVVNEIAVPLDWNTNAGPRHEATYTISTGVPTPQIVSAWFETLANGTGCSTGDERQVKVYWTTANVTSDSHDMQIYRHIVGASTWALAATATDPVNVTDYTFYVPMYASTSWLAQLWDLQVRLDLLSTDSVVDDSQLMDDTDIYTGFYCTT